MPRFCQRTFTLVVMLSLFALVLVPMGSVAGSGSHVTLTATGPTLPPPPWEGIAGQKTGPTLPPPPWEGIV